MAELSVDQRRLEICEGCPARKNIRLPEIVLLGSSCQQGALTESATFTERREIATMDAHLGTFTIINTEDRPEDGSVLVESVFEAVDACKDEESILIEGVEYCSAALSAGEIFYQKLGRAE